MRPRSAQKFYFPRKIDHFGFVIILKFTTDLGDKLRRVLFTFTTGSFWHESSGNCFTWCWFQFVWPKSALFEIFLYMGEKGHSGPMSKVGSSYYYLVHLLLWCSFPEEFCKRKKKINASKARVVFYKVPFRVENYIKTADSCTEGTAGPRAPYCNTEQH